jgi:gliding motility-associated-like protein
MNSIFTKGLVSFSFLLTILGTAIAQPGCPSVNAGTDVSLPCGTNCTSLTANYFQTGSTTSYTVGSIPYAPPFPFTGGTQLFINQDDIWGDVITLPFTFCFYGNSYTRAVIGANGLITFDLTQANQTCEWSYTASIPTPGPPSAGIYNNSINGAYHDIDPSAGGTLVSLFPPVWSYPANINYTVTGTAPCRILVVNFSTVPHYSCTNLRSTQQIVLYETTNVIEVYIKDKPTCNSWNNGNAVIGLQNSDGTQGITPPNRNTGPWTTSNEAWRFTPNGPSIVTVDWFQGATQIGTGATINVCPPNGTTTYTARATYLPCAGGTPVVVSDNVNVTLAGALQMDIDSSHNVSCFGANDGAVYAHASSTNPGLSYGWNDGNTNLVRTGLAAGTYIFTATDASGCVRRDTAIITAPTQVTATVPNVQQTTCSGTGTGILLATRGGGTGPYTFVWNSSPAQNDSVLDGVNPGTYNVTVTDSKGCTATASGTLTITAGANNTAFNAPVITSPACFGGTNGSITVSATGGSGTFTYNWNNSQTGATISSLSPGQYCVTADDGTGCTATACYNVNQPSQLVINPATTVDPTCNGTSDGSITASATGGTTAYTYSWTRQSNSQAYTGQSITGLRGDTYTLTVTDANSCSATASYTLNEASPVVINAPILVQPLCNGDANGSITITATGGTGGYSYSWAQQSGSGTYTGQTISSLGADTYNLTVTDVSGCTTTGSATLTEPAALVLNAPVIVNNGCNGNNSGAITANAGGGTGTYTYSWVQQSNSQTYTGQTISSLTGDNYALTVTDASGCTVTATYTVSSVTPLVYSQSQTDVTCAGGSNGSATITITSGTTPYAYNWNNNGPTATGTLNGVSAGLLTVVLNDANCSATATFTITEPTPVIVNQLSQTDVNCNGGNDGSITVGATGGTPLPGNTYNFAWSTTPPQVSATASGLTAGVYTVVAADANNCTTTATYTITEPTAVTATTSNTDVNCYAGSDGTVSANVSGGNSPYTYQWDDANSQTSKTAINLVRGTYNVLVTDANGCTTTAAGAVAEPAEIILNTLSTAVKCIGQTDGTITVTYTGGVAPFTYSATPDGINIIYSTDSLFDSLAIGTYTIQATDAHGCTQTAQAVVNNALLDNFVTSTDSTSCYGTEYNDGVVHIEALSLTNGPFYFSLDNGIPQLSGDFYNVAAGAHTVTATSNNNCVSTIPVLVLEPLPIVVDINPDTVYLTLGESQSVLATYINAPGQVTYNWTPELGLSCIDCPDPKVNVYTNQDYVLTVSMVNGSATCYGYATLHAEVAPPQPFFVPNAFSPNGDGNNDVFQIFGQSIKTITLKVFNRWGELVYQSDNQFDAWDGSYKGQLQMPGVFTYTAQVTYLDSRKSEVKGTVTLIR